MNLTPLYGMLPQNTSVVAPRLWVVSTVSFTGHVPSRHTHREGELTTYVKLEKVISNFIFI